MARDESEYGHIGRWPCPTHERYRHPNLFNKNAKKKCCWKWNFSSLTEFVFCAHRLVNGSRQLIRSGMWRLSHGRGTFSLTPFRPPFVRHCGMDPINLFGKSFPRANRRSNFLRRGRPPLNVMAEKKWRFGISFCREREREISWNRSQWHKFTSLNWMLNNVRPVLRSRILQVWSNDTENTNGWIRDFVTWRPVTGREWSDQIESGSHSWNK